MIAISDSLPITIDPEVMSGVPVFSGTRGPVTALIDNLAGGVLLDEFLDDFPTVQRSHAISVLEYFRNALKDIRLQT